MNASICQIFCISTAAHGPSVPGAIQCNLGLDLNIEAAAPCDGTDVTIQVGQTCIPVSTKEASSKIADANSLPGTVVLITSPSPPHGRGRVAAGYP